MLAAAERSTEYGCRWHVPHTFRNALINHTLQLVLLGASLFVVQNIVMSILWSTLYMAGPHKEYIDAAALTCRHQWSHLRLGSGMDNEKIVAYEELCVFSHEY